jgi:CheY-like chemotaxis protein
MNAVAECRIVLVDDVLEVRYLLRLLLANVRLCQVVAEAENGQQAVELVEKLRPDLVVLDVTMPVMGGIEALKRIRELSPETKVIVYSSSPEARSEALAGGAFRYLDKGADPQRLVDAVREAILG